MASSSRSNSPANTPKSAKGNGTLTGFVLKLCNMVNGAPDDVVSWVPSGEAFRISNLSRLEAETLPQYFRHSRFQSLVRQLNFYNFRKINRERTFWVYYHPLFHRDRPEEMHKLRRRTCPGFDGRRNRNNNSLAPPVPPDGVTWSNEDQTVRLENNAEEKEESGCAQAMVSPPGAGVKVSRSPSPSNSPMNHLPAGRGSVRSSNDLRGPSLKSIVSEEEKSSWSRQTSIASMSSDQGFADGQRDFYHADSADAEMNEYYAQNHSSEIGPADQLQVEENVVDQLNYHLDAPSYKGASFTKKSRKAKQTYHDEDLSFSTRKKYSKEELKERQAQLLAVTDVSRRLDGICAAHALSVAERNQERGGGRGKGRGRPGSEPATVPGQAVPLFGLDKPHDHYYGAGKCDLFTYDCDDGFVIDVDDCGGGGGRERRDSVVARGKGRGGAASRELREAPTAAAATPPSPCPLVNQSLVQACMEGKLVSSVSIFERTLASAVLSFCLSTHPRDPYLAKKISAHLKKGPMLAREFEMYCEAMAPGVHKDGGHGRGPSEDLKRDWKMFSSNLIDRVVLAHRNRDRLTAAENEAIGRCAASWSWSH